MMASSSLCLARFSPSSPPPLRRCAARLTSSYSSPPSISFKTNLAGSPLVLLRTTTLPPPSPSTTLTVFAHKGYKMKTHKASAKRFRVTGRGKIVRRCAGKQHLLGKKNTKRKLRLSKMTAVHKSDYDNVLGALPYLKVNRKAT